MDDTNNKLIEIDSANISCPFLYLFVKRVIDIIGALVGMILLAPIYFITAIAIKLENPKEKIIYSQVRNGKLSKTFRMYKFRSMVSNADELLKDLKDENEMKGPVFKIKNDPRITRVGKFIRKTSIDELPQLFNILKGEMSFVGPRPPLPSEVAQYNHYQMQRLYVKPGLTCYWQVSGRNNIDFNEWVELDLKYMRERNIWLDIRLIIKTIFVLFRDCNGFCI